MRAASVASRRDKRPYTVVAVQRRFVGLARSQVSPSCRGSARLTDPLSPEERRPRNPLHIASQGKIRGAQGTVLLLCASTQVAVCRSATPREARQSHSFIAALPRSAKHDSSSRYIQGRACLAGGVPFLRVSFGASVRHVNDARTRYLLA
ncbi:hypothetical protein MTO96_011583 [Rhipicephalus appendiculatus]